MILRPFSSNLNIIYLHMNFCSVRQSSMHSCLPLLTRNRFLTKPTSWCWWIRSKLQLLKSSSSVSSIPKFLGFAADELGLFFLNLVVETCWGKLHSSFAFRMHILVAYIVKTGNWDGLKASAKYNVYYTFKKCYFKKDKSKCYRSIWFVIFLQSIRIQIIFSANLFFLRYFFFGSCPNFHAYHLILLI